VKALRIGLLLATAALALTGCSDFVDRDQGRAKPGAEVTLEVGHPVGQTFVARHGGLDGVEVWLEPGQEGQGEIRLHLRQDPQAEEDLATAALPLEQVTAPAFYRFTFPPLPDSHGRYFYAFLETSAAEPMQAGAAPGDTYLDGALYRDHRPLDAQAAFRLVYDPRWLLLDLVRAVVGWLGLLGVAGLLYVVPGWALLAWLWRGERLPWAARLGVAVGLSLALYPLLFLWTDVVGLRLGSLYAWIPVVVGAGALLWRYRDWRPRKGWGALRGWARSERVWPDLALLMVAGMVFGVRLLVVRSLDAPMWGDSYQHTMITQLLVDNGGLFDSWEPYAELRTFTYHFGFHAAMAGFHWLTGMEMHQTVLWGGQVLNGLAVLALYPLAVRVGKSRWAGVGAVLVAGLLSPMPMYYVNWGRYTQLAGQVILPAAVFVSWAALETPRRDRRLVALSWLAVGGLALTHYRVLIFYVVFVLAWVLLALRRGTWRRALSRVVCVCVGAAVLFLPWFVHIFAGRILQLFGGMLSAVPGQSSSGRGAIPDLGLYLASAGWLLLVVAIAAGLWWRRRGVLLISLWWFLLFIATNPSWLRLPGRQVIRNHTLFMATYIPAGVLFGNLLGRLVGRVAESRRWYGMLAALTAVVVGLWGVPTRMGDVGVQEHALVTRPDLRAMAWVRENTPQGARFLVNSFFAYGGGVIVGSDGGWWLPLLAERDNTVPPLNYNLEEEPWAGYRLWLKEPTRQMGEVGIGDPAMLAMLRERRITYLYVGQQQGGVNYDGPDVLDPEALLGSEHYEAVYHQDRVWVFEVAE